MSRSVNQARHGIWLHHVNTASPFNEGSHDPSALPPRSRPSPEHCCLCCCLRNFEAGTRSALRLSTLNCTCPAGPDRGTEFKALAAKRSCGAKILPVTDAPVMPALSKAQTKIQTVVEGGRMSDFESLIPLQMQNQPRTCLPRKDWMHIAICAVIRRV